jgi:hypothetical protein
VGHTSLAVAAAVTLLLAGIVAATAPGDLPGGLAAALALLGWAGTSG